MKGRRVKDTLVASEFHVIETNELTNDARWIDEIDEKRMMHGRMHGDMRRSDISLKVSIASEAGSHSI